MYYDSDLVDNVILYFQNLASVISYQ